jgi:O-antigen/teichoic acid export membrane protein
MSTLRIKTVAGVKWQVLNKILQKIISVGTFAVLARILSPDAFGLFALAFVAIDGFQVFKSFGLDSALIQRKEKVDEAADTAFFLIQGSGFLLCVACYAMAPFAAQFFNSPELASVVRALGIVFIFTCFSKVPSTLLTKQMRFDVSSIIDLVGAVVNSVCAIGFALIYPSVWSLVWAYLAKQIVITALCWYYSGYKLHFRFEWGIAKDLFKFGKFMIGLSLLYLSDNIDDIFVGKMLGTTMLGYFALAVNIGNFINTHFTYLLSGVMFPAYASIQDDPESVRNAYFKTTKYVAMLSLPFGVALVCLAKEFVLTLYGAQWLAIVPLIQLFGAMQIVFPVLACSSSLFLGCGKPNYTMYLAFSQIVLRSILAIVFTQAFGLIGAVLAMVTTVLIFTPINIGLVRKIVPFQYRNFLPQFVPSLCSAAIMFSVILGLKSFIFYYAFAMLEVHYVAVLILLSVTGIAAYLASFYFLDRTSTLEATKLVLKMEKV